MASSKVLGAASTAIAREVRANGPDSPRLPDLRRDLRAVRLEHYVRELVAGAPPLTTEQLDRIAALLRRPRAKGRAG